MNLMALDDTCPVCEKDVLALNAMDLMECPNCHLVCAHADPVYVTVMPFKGDGKFRIDNGATSPYKGIHFCKAKPGLPLPDTDNPANIFQSKDELVDYFNQITEVYQTPPSKKVQAIAPADLWVNFRDAFKRYFETACFSDLSIKWTDTERTKRYCEKVMPYVAKELKFCPGKEEFKVDYVMSKYGRYLGTVEDAKWGFDDSKHDPAKPKRPLIPMVFVESENNIYDADHEIRKLCALNSPLRVLITVTHRDWSTMHDVYTHLHTWQAIIQDHAINNDLYGGVIGIIIGSRVNDPSIDPVSERVVYKSCAFQSDGHLLQPLQATCTGFIVAT